MSKNNNLKILVISSTYPRHANDYAVPWMREAHARLAKEGHELTVLAPSYKGLKSHWIDGIEVKRFRYAPRPLETLTHEEGAAYRVRRRWVQLLAIPYLIVGCLVAAWVAFRGKYDIIHVHWPFPHGLMGQAARFTSGARMVLMSHGAEFALAQRKKWIRPILRQSLRAADLRIANSTSTAKMVMESSNMSCEVVPYGTTVQAVNAPSQSNAIPRVLFTGRLIERKGVEYLLRAIPLVLRDHQAQFIITGNGDQRPKLEAIRDELQIQESVQFLGFVSNEQLSQEYAKCDIWVNPSIIDSWGDTEGLGVGSIEAYCYGKPVIASAVGGIPDTVIHGKTGFLVSEKNPEELASSISQLLSKPDLAKTMGSAGFAFAKRTFEWSAITSKLVSLYHSVLPNRANLVTLPSSLQLQSTTALLTSDGSLQTTPVPNTKWKAPLNEVRAADSTDLRRKPGALFRGVLLTGVGTCIAACMFFAGQSLVQNIDVLKEGPSWLIANAVALAILYRVANTFGWTLILQSLGARVDKWKATQVWLLSESSRWLPGSIWNYVSRVTMSVGQLNVTAPIALASMFIELILVLLAAVCIAAMGLPYFYHAIVPYWESVDTTTIVTIAMLTVLGGIAMAFVGRRQLVRKLLGMRSQIQHLKGRPVDYQLVGFAFAFFVAMNLFNGLITYLVASATYPSFEVPFVAVVGATSAAWICGFVAIVAPGGLMVREAAFAAMLLPWIGYSEAITIAVVARLTQLLAEGVTMVWVIAERALGESRSLLPSKRTP
jgi:glycosyltransferase involved in cell wall biosynthesis